MAATRIARAESRKIAVPRAALPRLESLFSAKDDAPIESVRSAYSSLTGLAPEVAKALACTGKNVVVYGPAQSGAMLSLSAFSEQVGLLTARLKSVLDIQAPGAPDKDARAGVYGVF